MLVTPLALRAGPAALQALPALARALHGEGPLLVPHAEGTAPAHLPDRVEGAPDDAAVAIGTSGSTGNPKLAVLSAAALRASADATHELLGGPGVWLLALPPHHIAGLQVLLRSLAAGHEPVPVERHSTFAPYHLADAVAAAREHNPGVRRYTSLVPTQLVRLLATNDGIAALRGVDGILVGGAATSRDVLERARAHGVPVVTTYGMSETCGGCVYDGRPLSGVQVRLEDGRVHLGGAPVAHGYLVDGGVTDSGVFTTSPDATAGGTRWFRTDDLGHFDHDRLVIDGRVDDVVITGGLKVLPRDVERAFEPLLPDGTSMTVVGVPDAEWGECVGAVFVPRPCEHPNEAIAQFTATLPALLDAARAVLPAHALPRRIKVIPMLPLRGPGKPDRDALRRLLGAEGHAHE